MYSVFRPGELGEFRLCHGQLLYYRMQLQYIINGVANTTVKSLPLPGTTSTAALICEAYGRCITEVRSGKEWLQESYTAALLSMHGILAHDLLLLIRRVRPHSAPSFDFAERHAANNGITARANRR